MEYHPVEHRVDIEVEGDVANVSFLPVVPDTIRVQVGWVEATSTDTSTPNSEEILNLQTLILRQKSNAWLLN